MIDANSAIVLKGLPEVIPEGELSHHIRMQRPKRVDVPEFEETTVLRTRFGLKERVTDPGGRLVAIDILWNDIKVSAYQRRRIVPLPNF